LTLEESLLFLTTRTPSGGGFWIGAHHFVVRYSADSWEWEYRGNLFYDVQDLAEEVLKRCGPGSRITRFFTERIPDERRELRA
jgi:hypothetical protein